MLFEELNIIEPILKALKTEGYNAPTPIQEQSIPIILERKDLLGCAQTGTGRTGSIWNPDTSNILWYTSISYGNMLMYDAIWCQTTSLHILVYVKIWKDISWYHCIYSYMSKYEMISLHILVYTSISYMTVYGGICLFMMVYTFETKYIPSYPMLKLWHEMFMDLYNLTYVYILWPNDSIPAVPPRLARLKAANLLQPMFWFKALEFKHYGV